MRKPEPAIYELMLGVLDVDARDSVFVDDLAANLPPAAALGMTVVHHVDTRTTLAELDRLFAGRLSRTPVAARRA
jgi:putative hydrolase of the HAD superfamily